MEHLEGFIQYEKSSRRRASATPMVTIQKAGFLAFNKAAVEEWGTAPDFLVMYYNPKTKQIALVPSDITDRTALKVRYYNSGTGQISAQGFLAENKIDHSVISHYVPEVAGKVLIISLEKEGKEAKEGGTAKK